MALTSYCKKCRQDVPVGDVCPLCGGRLTPASVRVAWCVRHRPVADWMCWNAVCRILIPVWALIFGLILLSEGLSGGLKAVQALLSGGLAVRMTVLLGAALAVLGIALALQGTDLTDCVADSRGLHVRQYLPNPTPLKLLLRFRSPRLAREPVPGAETPLADLGVRELAWKELARIQLWQEKLTVICYAPAWWNRLSLPCTPDTWNDVLAFMRDKVGRKKNLLLPPELVAPPKPKAPKAAPETAQPEMTPWTWEPEQNPSADLPQAADPLMAADLPQGADILPLEEIPQAADLPQEGAETPAVPQETSQPEEPPRENMWELDTREDPR